MTVTAMREALHKFVEQKKATSDGRNIEFEKNLLKVSKILESDVELSGKEMVKLQLKIIMSEEKEDNWQLDIKKRREEIRIAA